MASTCIELFYFGAGTPQVRTEYFRTFVRTEVLVYERRGDVMVDRRCLVRGHFSMSQHVPQTTSNPTNPSEGFTHSSLLRNPILLINNTASIDIPSQDLSVWCC